MRSDLLDPFFSPVSSLSGVGPKVEKLLNKLVLWPPAEPPATIADLLFHLPVSTVDRSNKTTVIEAPIGEISTMSVEVVEVRGTARGSRAPVRIITEDDTASLEIVYFNAKSDWLAGSFKVGSSMAISGKVELWNGQRQLVHPDYAVPVKHAGTIPAFERIYPMVAGLGAARLRKAIDSALRSVSSLPEWHDAALPTAQDFLGFDAALKALHDPTVPIDNMERASRRLAYDELLSSQLAIALIRHFSISTKGEARPAPGHIAAKIVSALPFELTGAQKRAGADIRKDLQSPQRMVRLLQGDVGSGKTVVALLAMADIAETAAQSALMAPTEVLARQHYQTLHELGGATGLSVEILTGREKGQRREAILAGLSDGSIDVIVGTHALIQDSVEFKNLGLVVIDEQHRFGVSQRLKLSEKGTNVDLLAMTATPIPRTLVLAWYGDLDVSRLDEKPAGRKPVDTRAVPKERIDEVIERLRGAIERGAKGYWICPLVEESEESDLTSATERYEALVRALGPKLGARIGLVHGQMRGDDKDAALSALKAGPTQILVATTVVEVGVDVGDATIMVIEHAERFGLSQLHQLRGRVGRGNEPSTCLLLYGTPLGNTARARLEALRESDDGFVLAEKDLELRGIGDVLGTRQSGFNAFRLADPARDADLIALAHDDARMIVANDPFLKTERGEALRLLLQLFRRDTAVRLIQAG
ncbi:MAG: ATP-dependent DNA helicase RecG [Pseudomonadota bacterium]